MDNLLSAQLCLDDFIFVHRKGTKLQAFYPILLLKLNLQIIYDCGKNESLIQQRAPVSHFSFLQFEF